MLAKLEYRSNGNEGVDHWHRLLMDKFTISFPEENEEAMNHEFFHRSWDEFHRTNSSSTKIVVSVVEHALPCVQCKCSP